jgi:hypothetical protein
MAWTKERIDDVFTYHPPEHDQIPRYENIREGAKAFAEILIQNTYPGADQHAAMRLLRECCFTANASVALRGQLS